LFAIYKADKHRADRALKGSSIQVVGTLTRVGRNEVALQELGDSDSVKCKFVNKEILAHGRVSVGTTATVKGRVKGRGITGDIHLVNCELVGP
jgi:hypothetical protein